MAYKMKGPSMYPNYRGNKPAQQAISVKRDGNPGADDGRAASSPLQMHKGKAHAKMETIKMKKGSAADKKSGMSKKTKTKEDYIKEGFTPSDADKMMRDGAVTGVQPSPNKFFGKIGKALGGAAKGILGKAGGMAKGALMGKDGKFGIGDVGRLAMGPMGAAAGATGLFQKENPSKGHSNMNSKQITDEANALNAKRRALIKSKKTNKKSPAKNYKKGYYGA